MSTPDPYDYESDPLDPSDGLSKTKINSSAGLGVTAGQSVGVDWDAIPAPRGCPAPPSFGWVINPARLTGDELMTIEQLIGDIKDAPLHRFKAYVAVAYARRVDPVGYPWAVADRIPVDQLPAFKDQPSQKLTADEEEAHAAAVSEAIEHGQAPPDPD